MGKLNGVKTLDMANGEITKVAYDGAVYEKVDGKAQVGDLVEVINGFGDLNPGDFGKVLYDHCNDITVFDGCGHRVIYRGKPDAVNVFRKVTANQSPTPATDALPDRVSTLEQRVDKLEGKTATDGFKLVTDREPKAGDFVKFTDDDELPSYLTVGKYYEITEIDFADDPQILDDDGDDHDTGGYTYEVFEKVNGDTPKVEPSQAKLKVGDYAKITGIGDKTPYRSHKFALGTIVRVLERNSSGDRFRAEYLDGSDFWWVLDEYAIKATDEEVAQSKAEYERKATEERWAKIGRKPNEFKKGDIVLTHDATNGHKGVIGEVVRNPTNNRPYVMARYIDGREIPLYSDSTLITPVEQRFDLEGATA